MSSTRIRLPSLRACSLPLAFLLLSGAAPAALAHEISGMGEGFVSGFAHPFLGLDHVLAMVAVGLWGAILRQPAIWQLPVAFPLVMALGGMLGVAGVPLPAVEVGIALSALVLGLMIAGQARPPLWLALTLVAVFALCHGHAHGTELPAAANPATYALGFILATGLLHAIGIAFGLLNHLRAGRALVQAGGVLIALGGAYYLFQQVA